MRPLLRCALAVLLGWAPAWAAERKPIVVIAHPRVGRVDRQTLQRLYMGRALPYVVARP